MAKINLTRHVVAPVVVGGVHAAAEWADESQGWAAPASAGFVVDVGMPILGGIGYSMDMAPGITEPALMCGMTLLTGRLIEWVRGTMATTGRAGRAGKRVLVSRGSVERYPAPPYKETVPEKPRLI